MTRSRLRFVWQPMSSQPPAQDGGSPPQTPDLCFQARAPTGTFPFASVSVEATGGALDHITSAAGHTCLPTLSHPAGPDGAVLASVGGSGAGRRGRSPSHTPQSPERARTPSPQTASAIKALGLSIKTPSPFRRRSSHSSATDPAVSPIASDLIMSPISCADGLIRQALAVSPFEPLDAFLRRQQGRCCA